MLGPSTTELLLTLSGYSPDVPDTIATYPQHGWLERAVIDSPRDTDRVEGRWRCNDNILT